jgi:guanylate kinase
MTMSGIADVARDRAFILCAASGTGKTSLAQALVRRHADLAFSISHTTRSPRPGEVDGVHYHFVTPAQFEALVHADGFLEHAEVFGNRYGTSRASVEELLKQGKRVILDIDWQGARSIKKAWPDAVSIFLLPPSRDALEQRLKDRRQDSPEVIQRRMAAAISEMRHYREFDHVVINDDFELAVADLEAIISGNPGAKRLVTLDIEGLLRA